MGAGAKCDGLVIWNRQECLFYPANRVAQTFLPVVRKMVAWSTSEVPVLTNTVAGATCEEALG